MFKSYGVNSKGTDWVVGDIHGCFTKLAIELYTLGFNEEQDRLFSVGDLIDRGPESDHCLNWLGKPWFHAVRGNHEQMLIDAVDDIRMAEGLAMNGGSWFFDLSPKDQEYYALLLSKLPLAIEVQTEIGLVGIIHAEVYNNDWTGLKALLRKGDSAATNQALWARSRIKKSDTSRVAGVDTVYVGHTPTKEVVQLGNVVYLDTGAVFQGGKMSIVPLRAGIQGREI